MMLTGALNCGGADENGADATAKAGAVGTRGHAGLVAASRLV